MDICDDLEFRPLTPCTFGVLCSALCVLAIVAQLVLFIHNYFIPPRCYHSGYLPFTFFISCLLQILIIFLPIGYLLYTATHLNLPITVFLIAHSVYWIFSLCSHIAARNFVEHPLLLVLLDSAILLLSIVPIFFWQTWFYDESGRFSTKVVTFYGLELLIVVLLFTLMVTRSTIRQTDMSSVWAGFSKKCALSWPYIWPRSSFLLQARVIVCLLLLVFGRIVNVALPLYSKWIVDELSHPASSVYNLIVISCVLKFLQGNGAMGGFLNTMRTYLWIPVQQYTTYQIQVELFTHLHNLSLSWHLSRKTGQVLRIMDRGTSSINSVLSYLLFNVFPTIFDILIAVIFFFSSYYSYFGVLVLLTMSIYLVVTIWLTEWRAKFRREMNETENISRSIGVDSLLNYESIKYYCAEEREVERFGNSFKRYQKAEWASSASLSLLNMSQNATIGVGLIVGSLLIAYLIEMDPGSMTAGDYVLFTTYMLQLYMPLNFFGTVYRVIQQSFIDMENMFDLLSEEVEIVDSPWAIPLEPRDGSIELKDVYFRYSEQRPVLNGISFKVNRGETLALVGPSGAGKSTIVRLLFRLYDINDGDILYDGQSLKDITVKSLRRDIAVVPQDTVLFNETIMYNIRFGNPKATDREVEDAARRAEIHNFIQSLPDGYETVVGERGLKLSGGEKQRVAIARALLKKPRYIFLDEATSALDTSTERSIQRCLQKICAFQTTIIVAHRLSTIVNADRILVIEDGRVVESGTHSELLALNAVYYSMWEAQKRNTRDESE